MEDSKITHVAFSDESSQNQGRFRSISVISLDATTLDEVNQKLLKTLKDSGITSEYKWSKTNSAKYKFAAINLIDTISTYILGNVMRIDTIIWDTHDSRHQVVSRDDHRNFSIMYYRPLLNCLENRWPRNAIWGIYPDETNEINWEEFQEILEASSSYTIQKAPLIPEEEVYIQGYFVSEIKQRNSKEFPIIQVADLFAGMAACSWNNHSKLLASINENNGQLFLFSKKSQHSNAIKQRSEIISHLDSFCKAHNMQVSFRSSGGLFSYKPSMPINFWKYEPQHELDKAPTVEN